MPGKTTSLEVQKLISNFTRGFSGRKIANLLDMPKSTVNDIIQ